MILVLIATGTLPKNPGKMATKLHTNRIEQNIGIIKVSKPALSTATNTINLFRPPATRREGGLQRSTKHPLNRGYQVTYC